MTEQGGSRRNDEQVFEGIELASGTAGRPAEAPKAASARATFRAVGKSKLAVLAILFFATGVLGIPLLFYSERFTTTERIVWSIIITLYTAALIGLAAVIWIWSWNRINPAIG